MALPCRNGMVSAQERRPRCAKSKPRPDPDILLNPGSHSLTTTHTPISANLGRCPRAEDIVDRRIGTVALRTALARRTAQPLSPRQRITQRSRNSPARAAIGEPAGQVAGRRRHSSMGL